MVFKGPSEYVVIAWIFAKPEMKKSTQPHFVCQAFLPLPILSYFLL